MSARNVMILGATSAIAEAFARRLAAAGDNLLLVARDEERTARIAADLDLLGTGTVGYATRDLAMVPAGAEDEVAPAFDAFCEALPGPIDVVAVFYGVLGDQSTEEATIGRARDSIRVNFTSVAEWALAAANRLEAQDRGVLLVVSSVAGDRGRQSNYVYGSAKAGLSALVQGIAHRLARGGARAVVAKLGFVDTPMTAHIDKGGPLWATPDQVAGKLEAAVDRPGAPVIYVPGFWRLIMLVIRNVPAFVFHKTQL